MMKSLFRSLAAVLVMGSVACLPAAARADQAGNLASEIELLRSDLKTDKMELVKEALNLDQAKADAFWPVYRKYSLELDQIGDKRLALIKDYADNYDKMTDEKAKTLVKQALDLQKKRIDLLSKYYGQFEKVIGATEAAKLVQVEHLMMALVDVQLGAHMPLVEKTASASTGTK
jgi:methanogenic corrinoid protein MtbC1